jgi:hypothetical protein
MTDGAKCHAKEPERGMEMWGLELRNVAWGQHIVRDPLIRSEGRDCGSVGECLPGMWSPGFIPERENGGVIMLLPQVVKQGEKERERETVDSALLFPGSSFNSHLFFFFFPCGSSIWTSGLMLARQALYQLSYTLSPFLLWLVFR